MHHSSPARLAGRYVALTYAGSWACWAAALVLAGGTAPASTLASVLQVLGTLVPLFMTYLLFPQLRACGLVEGSPVPGPAQARDGFWAYVLGPRAALRPGLAAFAVLFVWRWVMFRLAFGFPASPLDALANAWYGLPLLLLGGGLEEVGWRGCLQPALARALRGRLALLAPLVTGIVWGLWHLPLFALPGSFQARLGIPLGVLAVVGVGVALSYSFAGLAAVSRSPLACVFSHAWYNAMLVEVPAFSLLAFALFAIEAAAGLTVLCLRTGPADPPAPHRPVAEEPSHEPDRRPVV